MKGLQTLVLLLCLAVPLHAQPEEFVTAMQPLIDASCIQCHDENTETRLNFAVLGDELSDAETFRVWESIYDRIERGEMPPASEPRPDKQLLANAVASLKKQLHDTSLSVQQTAGRVPSRRLTRTEYENTLHDLLGIGGNLAKHLPPENESGAFDVVAATQEMSSVHVRGLLTAADLALDEAIQLGKKPPMAKRKIDYINSRYIQMWVDREVRRGGGTIFKTNTDVVTFRGENFVFRSDVNGFIPPATGRYRITVKAAAYQPRSSITVSLKLQNDTQGDSELFAAWDLVGEDYRELETTKFLRPDDYIYVSADELEPAPDGKVIYNGQPASTFGGEGVKIQSVTVEGPLEMTWPPERTRKLFSGVKWKARAAIVNFFQQGSAFEPELTQSPLEHVRRIVSEFAPRAFRRNVSKEEIDAFVDLAKLSVDAKRDFVQSVRIPLRAILVSPQLLFLAGEAGRLNDVELASRLSYFLWRSLPDDELLKLAYDGKLSDPDLLAQQVDRMLNDPRCERFVNDFLDQWLELDRIDATTPDAYLYPEYDDVLRRAILAETREFFAHLIDENLSVENLVDSDFTFLNRKLAEHYGIENVVGENMRKVTLDPSSVRGGILTHASIAKVTANGTVTTPVKRGNFVLTNLLGLPPNPPPPGVGSIEPDTRGATTIRETLLKHQSVEACAVCHRRIDPPGFALECFDPVGTFRDRYRNSKGVKRELNAGLRFLHKDYNPGLRVDASGTTEEGFKFKGIRDYKKHLRQSTEQVARNLIFRLIACSTGGEVTFADREVVERILWETQKDGYPLRTLIHQVIASRIFRNR